MTLASSDLFRALQAAGVFPPGPTDVRRFVIDARVGQPVRMYVQRMGGDELATVLPQQLVTLDSGDIFDAGTPAAAAAQEGEPETERESAERDEAGRRARGEATAPS